MAANSVGVMEAVVALLEDELGDDTELLIAKRYRQRKNLSELENKHLDVFPLTFADEGPADRKKNFYDVTLSIHYTERYVNQSAPEIPDEWVEERIDFVESQLFALLADSRLQLEVEGKKYWPQTAEIVTLCHPVYLDEDNVYWAEMEITFRKIDTSPVTQGS